MISLVFGWFLSIVISEIFWYSRRVTGIFYSKEKKVYKTAFMSAGEYVRYRYGNSHILSGGRKR